MADTERCYTQWEHEAIVGHDEYGYGKEFFYDLGINQTCMEIAGANEYINSGTM